MTEPRNKNDATMTKTRRVFVRDDAYIVKAEQVALALSMEGASIRSVARMYEVTPSSLWRFMRDAGYQATYVRSAEWERPPVE